MPSSPASEPFPDTTDDPFADPSPGTNGSTPHEPPAATEPDAKVIEATFAPRALHPEGDLEFYSSETTIVVFNTHMEADAAKLLLPDNVCLGWSGIRREADQYNWTPLLGRQVLIWPAATHSSADAAQRVSQLLPDALILRTPSEWTRPGLPAGLSIADAVQSGFSSAEAKTWISRELQRIEDQYESIRCAAAEPDHVESEYALHDPLPQIKTDDWPFAPLGVDHLDCFYLVKSTQQIVEFQAAAHTRANLRFLAQEQWWEQKFPNSKESGCAWNAAANAVIQASQRRPGYDRSRIRGRGCWLDKSRVTFHAGDRLIEVGANSTVDHRLDGFGSAFIYERGPTVSIRNPRALANAEAGRLLDVCSQFSWSMPIFGRFLAGWCVVAPFCGALEWRPHIWVTGSSASGKTTCVTKVIDPLLGSFALNLQGVSSEAGCRQFIKQDAIPVRFEEAEGERERGHSRMQAVLELVRQASSESGGVIAKGTVTGDAIAFNVRSCFCFSSIGVSAVSRPDVSRVTVLTLEKRHDPIAYDALLQALNETTLNPEWCAALRWRTLTNLTTLRANARTFARAVASKLKDSRAGDQLGALIAGAFSLTSTREIELARAKLWVDSQDWTGFITDAADADENQALARLLDHQIRVDGNGSPYTSTIGALITKALDSLSGPEAREACTEILMMHGIKVDEDSVHVANTHASIAKIYADSPWTGKWKDQLCRIPGAKAMPAARFKASVHRSVQIPKEYVLP